jgi:hypothetical protein
MSKRITVAARCDNFLQRNVSNYGKTDDFGTHEPDLSSMFCVRSEKVVNVNDKYFNGRSDEVCVGQIVCEMTRHQKSDNSKVTKIWLSLSKVIHLANNDYSLTVCDGIPIFQSHFEGHDRAIICHYFPIFFREAGEKESERKVLSNMECSELNQAFLVMGVESVNEILELGGGSHFVIPSSIDVISQSYVASLGPYESIGFEKDSKVQRIERLAFRTYGLKSIVIPSSIEILCKSCFGLCTSLESIVFENDSKLIRIERGAFVGTRAFINISESILSHFRRATAMPS